MEFANAFNAPVVVATGDTEVHFPKLSPPEVALECARIQRKKIEKAQRLVDKVGLKGQEAYNILSDAEEGIIINHVWAEAATPQGAIDICTTSLKKDNKNESEIKEILGKLETEQLVEVALKVTGYKIVPPSDEKKKATAKEEPVGFKT